MIKLGPAKWALLLMSTLTVAATTPIAPVLPKLAEAFAHEPRVELLSRLVLTMPALFVIFGAPVAGLVADRYGRRPLALGSMALYSIAGTSAYFADTLMQILVGRALLGLGMAGIFTAATALISDHYYGRERSRLMGFQGAAMTVGGVIFTGLGGILAELGWRLPFLLYLLGLGVLVLAALVIVEPRARRHRPLAEGEKHLPVMLFALLYGAAILGHAAFFAVPVQMPFHLLETFGIGGVGTGFILALAIVFAAITSVNYGRIKGHLSYSAILILCYALMGIGFTIVGLSTHVAMLAGGLCISGAAAGVLLPVMNNWVTDITSNAARARALAVFSTTIFLGQFLSPLATTPLVQHFGYGAFFLFLGLSMLALCLVVIIGARSLNRITREWSRWA